MVACAPYRKNPLSSSFHNMTAHYNSYFIAKERIMEIEQAIFDGYQWNYNKTLPVYPQFDSTQSATLKDQIEDCIQKSSISIQRHPGSKWEDDSYILVGKARYYAMEFPDAIETFKYVNTKSKNNQSRHEALVELIRTFTDFNEYNNAIAVSDYVEKEDLNLRNKRVYHLNVAYLHQKRGDEDKMVEHLVKAEELLNKQPDKARINFIIGQTYHSLGFESEAFRYYKNVLRSKPNYKLEFYAKLCMAQVTELANANDLKKIQRYFTLLLKDTKNEEYKDKIHYELAGFELTNGNIDEAIFNYQLSVKESKNNQRQKAYSYLKLGEIYYDSLKDFTLAKSYYDSTVSTLPTDEENYPAIKNRQEILADFVTQVEIINKNDSLLSLSILPMDSLLALAVSKIQLEKAKDEERKAKEKKVATRHQNNDSNNENTITTDTENSIWYFSNNNALSKGRSEFARKWGNIILEDNWRRKNKRSNAISTTSDIKESSQKTPSIDDEEIDITKQAESLLSEIPTKEEQKIKLLSEIEDAYYQLGNIYNLRLEEDENAAGSFETLLNRFPKTEYKPEVLYQLFLIYKSIDLVKSTEKGMLLKQKFPETIYAKLMENPNYREESFATGERLKKLYRNLYLQYETGNYDEVIFSSDSVLRISADNEFSDNIRLLQILAIGKKEGDRKYQYEIGNFFKEYPESELISYASSLLKAAEDFQQNRYNSASARFIEDFNQKHFFVLVYDIKESLTSRMSSLIEKFLQENNFSNLKTGTLILNQTKSMLLVNEFPGKATATGFSSLFQDNVSLSDAFQGQKIDAFVITEDNFDILYKTKNVSAYLNFFEKHYK